MKKLFTYAFLLASLIAGAQVDSLKNASLIGQSSRNQKVGQGFQVGFIGSSDDTCQINTKLQLTSGTPASGKVLTSDANGFGTWQAANVGWALTGNAGTNPFTDFVGTTDQTNLYLGASSIRNFQLDTLGRLLHLAGIATDSFFEAIEQKSLVTFGWSTPSKDWFGFYNFDPFNMTEAYFNTNTFASGNRTIGIDTLTGETTNNMKLGRNDTLIFQMGIWDYPSLESGGFSGQSTELSVHNSVTGLDLIQIAGQYDPENDLGFMNINQVDSSGQTRNLRIKNNDIIPHNNVFNLGTVDSAFKTVNAYQLQLHGVDSVTIWSSIPTAPGTFMYCNNCQDSDGDAGSLVKWNGAAWKKED